MPYVLFVCVHNAGRSQMAQAFFNQLASKQGLHWYAQSGGTIPAIVVHANVVAVMREAGIDLLAEAPKALSNEVVAGAEKVITMGCAVDATACPAVFLKDVEDWGLTDPADRSIEEVRSIREAVRQRVEELVGLLGR